LYWGLAVLALGWFLWIAACSSHFRVDRVQAHDQGLRVVFWHIPTRLGRYVMVETALVWSGVRSISEGGDGQGNFWLNVSLHEPICRAEDHFTSAYATEQDMKQAMASLKRLAPPEIF
jgi:hypothetical protein